MVQPQGSRPGAALRIVLAHDLSDASELAVGVLHGPEWPPSTLVRLVTSPMGVGPGRSSFANIQEVRAHAEQVRHAIEATHERVAADLRRAGLTVETAIGAGQPEDVILEEADRLGADLVMVGARRQGSLAATLLGSVSRAVVERSPGSVFVARSVSTGRVLLAIDGSAPGRIATSVVGTWPMFAGAEVLLLGVGEAPPGYPGVVLSDAELSEAYAATIASATGEMASLVAEAAEALAAEGRRVEQDIRLGELASELLAAAEIRPADVVVLASDPKPLLLRLLAGTSARRVLDGVPSSVLVVRGRDASDAGPGGR